VSGDGGARADAGTLALRGIAREISLSWIILLLLPIGLLAVVEGTAGGVRHGFRSSFLIQLLLVGSMWLNRMPSTRLVMLLPRTRRQSETTLWAVAFALPLAYYALVFGSRALLSGWHGHAIWPSLLLLLDAASLQGILVLSWSLRPDSAGRSGWPGWTSRSATQASAMLALGGFAVCLSPVFGPAHAAPFGVALALAAGTGACLLVWLRRDVLLKRHAVMADFTQGASARGWWAYAAVLRPWIGLTLSGSIGVPVLMLTARHSLAHITPVLLTAPLLFSFVMPMAVLRSLRVIRMLPVSAGFIAILLIAAVAIGPAATCLLLMGAVQAIPALHAPALSGIGWVAPALSVSLLLLPLALRFERLWLVGACIAPAIAGFSLSQLLFPQGDMPRLPVAGDLGWCLAVLVLSFLWLRWEIGAARGIGLRTATPA
jgi:hypothetical protein